MCSIYIYAYMTYTNLFWLSYSCIEISKFDKILVLVLVKMIKHKNGFLCLIFELKCLLQVYISMQNIKTIFRDFYMFYKIFRNMFNCFSDPVSDPEQWLTGQVGRPHGRPNQGPVDPAVDRRAQPCARLAAQWAGWPSGRPDLRAELSVYLGRPDGRSVYSNGRIFDRWRSAGRLTGLP